MAAPLPVLRDLLSQKALVPTLRLMRDRMKAHPDYREVRAWAARIDRLAQGWVPDGVRITPAQVGGVDARWVEVKGARKDRVMLYLAGGAFIVRTPTLHNGLVARIGAVALTRALLPDYRLAPEHPYPAGLDDGFACYRQLLADGVAAQDIVVAGDSAGGNLALALLLRVRDAGLPLPACAVALSPVTDITLGGDSIRRNDGRDAMFTPQTFEALAPLYLPQAKLAREPYASPLLGELGGLPPILIPVGSTELLLDDSVRFACRCPSAQLEVWDDMPHVFPAFGFLPEAADATERIGAFIRRHLADAGRAAAQAAAPAREAAEDRSAAEAAGAGEAPAAEAGDARVAPRPRQRRSAIAPIGWVYFALGVLAALVALASLWAPGFGSPPSLLWLATGWGAFGAGAWIGTALVLLFAAASVPGIGLRRAAWPGALTLVFGFACGLAFLLFERERQVVNT